MTEIVLDGSEWKSAADFYSALLEAIQAPEWHGRNLDALWARGIFAATARPSRNRCANIPTPPRRE